MHAELDAYTDFDKLKPPWCKGLLRENRSGTAVYFYVNFGSACGCRETQTTKVKLSKGDDTNLTNLAARQTAAAQKVLNKVGLSLWV